MYRIEVAPGEEAVFRTIEELATGIKNGLITSRSRIFHAASQKWLPIEFHPHYKKALASLDRPKPLPGTSAAAAPVPAAAAQPAPPPPPAAAPARQAVPAAAPASSSWGRPKELEFIEVELPRISYPEFPPAVAHAAEAEPDAAPLPVARRRSSGGRPMMYAGAVLALVAVGYVATTMVLPAGQAAAASTSHSGTSPAVEPAAESDGIVTEEVDAVPPAPEPAAVAPKPVASKPAEPRPVEPKPVQPQPRPSKPSATTPVAAKPLPRVSGPASQAWSSSAGAIAPLNPAPPPSAAPSSGAAAEPAIEPPPAAVDLAVPTLPVSDSLAPRRPVRDSAAMKRILKAVSGTKR